MRISLALHIIGMVMWVGGLMFLTRFMKIAASDGAQTASLREGVGKMWVGAVLPGFLIALLTGLYQLTLGGLAVYMKAGWFHGKLLFVVVLLVVTAIVWMDVRRCANGESLKSSRIMAMHGLSAISLIVIVFLTMVLR